MEQFKKQYDKMRERVIKENEKKIAEAETDALLKSRLKRKGLLVLPESVFDITEKDKYEAFKEACREGDLDFARWFFETLNIKERMGDYINGSSYEAILFQACEEGHIDIAKWMYKEGMEKNPYFTTQEFLYQCVLGNLEAAREIYKKRPVDVNYPWDAFYYACEFGHLELVKWMYKTFGDLGVAKGAVIACKKGHLPVLEFLFNIKDAYRIDRNKVTTIAIEKDDLEIMQWLCVHGEADIDFENFLPVDYDEFMDDYMEKYSDHNYDSSSWSAERRAASEKLLEYNNILGRRYKEMKGWPVYYYKNGKVSNWLYETYQENKDFLKKELNVKPPEHICQLAKNKRKYLKKACTKGKLDVLKWLYHFGFRGEIHWNEDCMFREACANGHLGVAKWIYSLGDVYIYAKENEVYRKAEENGHKNVCKWLEKISNKSK